VMPGATRAAIVRQQFLQAIVLRVSIHILEIRQLFHLRKQNGPNAKDLHIIRLNCYW